MKSEIINNEWAAYDEIKTRQKANPKFMNLDARWEVNYLADVISARYPEIAVDQIKIAIYSYTQAAAKQQFKEQTFNSKNDREHVLHWVLKRLEAE